MACGGQKKKNAFFVYMEGRRSEVEAGGHRLTRGFDDLAQLVSADWKKVAPEEKAVYEEKARKYNENITRENKVGTSAIPKQGEMLKDEHPIAYKLRMEKEEWHQKFLQDRELNRDIVRSMFDKEDWISLPIVVCNFALFFEPNPRCLLEYFIPAEVGLTAFSVKDGIVDNFARLIDPDDDLPSGRGYNGQLSAWKMGHPTFNTCPELKDYDNMLYTIESFLAKYSFTTNGDLVMFAANRELEKVTKCLEWICEMAGRPVSFKVLSLSLWAHLASTDNNKRYRSKVDAQPFSSHLARRRNTVMAEMVNGLLHAAQMTLATAANRSVGTSLTPCFCYPSPDDFPLVTHGIFLYEEYVDEMLERNTNYMCYEEIGCLYHSKKLDGATACALNVANRIVYCLLEVLTISNLVPIRRGGHFPTVKKLAEERERRVAMLKRWGFTELERTMEDEAQRLEEDAQQQRNNRRGSVREEANRYRNVGRYPRNESASLGGRPDAFRSGSQASK